MQTTNGTILIIDDCAPIAEIIAGHLLKAGYQTRIARDATEAQRILAGTTPACILLDLMMPGMSGAELLHAIRVDVATADIPVILVSARIGHHGTHSRSQMDANYSVGKPFTRQQIVQAVRTVLAKRDGIALPPVAAASLPRVDAKARIAAQLGVSGFAR